MTDKYNYEELDNVTMAISPGATVTVRCGECEEVLISWENISNMAALHTGRLGRAARNVEAHNQEKHS